LCPSLNSPSPAIFPSDMYLGMFLYPFVERDQRHASAADGPGPVTVSPLPPQTSIVDGPNRLQFQTHPLQFFVLNFLVPSGRTGCDVQDQAYIPSGRPLFLMSLLDTLSPFNSGIFPLTGSLFLNAETPVTPPPVAALIPATCPFAGFFYDYTGTLQQCAF